MRLDLMCDLTHPRRGPLELRVTFYDFAERHPLYRRIASLQLGKPSAQCLHTALQVADEQLKSWDELARFVQTEKFFELIVSQATPWRANRPSQKNALSVPRCYTTVKVRGRES